MNRKIPACGDVEGWSRGEVARHPSPATRCSCARCTRQARRMRRCEWLACGGLGLLAAATVFHSSPALALACAVLCAAAFVFILIVVSLPRP